MKNYYLANEVYAETYFQLPKLFFTNKKYIYLSDGAKIAYAILKDRFNYSVKNNWIDKEGRIYFIFTVKELEHILNCGNKKVIKIKKELEKVNLLEQVQLGLNLPNRLYLLKPQAEAYDVYRQTNSVNEIDNLSACLNTDTKGSVKTTLPKIKTKTLDSKGSVKTTLPKIKTKTLDSKGSVKTTLNLYKEQKTDTKKIDTKKIDTKKAEQLDQELLATFHLTNTQTYLSENCLKFIALYSKTFQQAYEIVGLINRAKKKVEVDTGILLIGEDWQEELDLHVRRVVQKIRTDHTIKQADNYMFKSFCYFFEECCHELNKADETTPSITVSLHNWLE